MAIGQSLKFSPFVLRSLSLLVVYHYISYDKPELAHIFLWKVNKKEVTYSACADPSGICECMLLVMWQLCYEVCCLCEFKEAGVTMEIKFDYVDYLILVTEHNIICHIKYNIQLHCCISTALLSAKPLPTVQLPCVHVHIDKVSAGAPLVIEYWVPVAPLLFTASCQYSLVIEYQIPVLPLLFPDRCQYSPCYLLPGPSTLIVIPR